MNNKKYSYEEKYKYHVSRLHDNRVTENQREYSWRWWTAAEMCKSNLSLNKEDLRTDPAVINAKRAYDSRHRRPVQGRKYPGVS